MELPNDKFITINARVKLNDLDCPEIQGLFKAINRLSDKNGYYKPCITVDYVTMSWDREEIHA
jgi:hypothetical protein